MVDPKARESASEKQGEKRELYLFLTVTLIVLPALAVFAVGGFGLVVWIYQMIAGPPGPPGG